MIFSIQDLINKKINEREEKEIKSWHASRLGSCLTGLYLERLGVKPDDEFDNRTLRVFSAGKIFEDWVVGLVENNGVKIEKQVRIELPQYDLTGYADFVVENENEKLVYEVKSKHSNAFWYMEKKGEGANRQHEMQLWCYLKALNIPDGRIIYLSKDDLAILEYQVKLNDEKLAGEVLAELKILNEAWKQKLPPEPIKDEKDWRYKYCRWHKQCLSQEKYLSI